MKRVKRRFKTKTQTQTQAQAQAQPLDPSSSSSSSSPSPLLPAVIPQPITVPLDFREANYTLKRQLLHEYKSLAMQDKAAWRKAHNCTQALIRYYSKTLLKGKQWYGPKRDMGVPAPASPRPPSPKDAVTLEMVREYMSLDSGSMTDSKATKSMWLKRHGLNHQQIFDVKTKFKLMGLLNGKGNSKTASNGHVRQSPVPSPVPSPSVFPSASPSVPLTTLDEAINAMKVKRDMLSSFIEDLERMRH